MNEKIFKRLMLMLIFMITSFPISANTESRDDSSSSGNGDAVLRQHDEYPDIKRCPSKIILEVVYSDGMLTLISNYYEGAFSLRFENYDTGESHEVSSILVGESIPVQLNYGEYEVKAISEEGIVLSGFMQVY